MQFKPVGLRHHCRREAIANEASARTQVEHRYNASHLVTQPFAADGTVSSTNQRWMMPFPTPPRAAAASAVVSGFAVSRLVFFVTEFLLCCSVLFVCFLWYSRQSINYSHSKNNRDTYSHT